MPLNTLEMQKRACTKLRQSPEAIMKLAEELYQTGFISYPRTETDSFPEDLDLRAIVGAPQWRAADAGAGRADVGTIASRVAQMSTGRMRGGAPTAARC